jgi:hypothetical protein
MNFEAIKKQFFEILHHQSLEDAQKMLNEWILEVRTTRLREQLKEQFKHVPKLSVLADQVTVHYYNWMRLDYRIMEECGFDIRHEDTVVTFSWSYYCEPGEIDIFFLLNGDDVLQHQELDVQYEKNVVDISLNAWKKVAYKLNILDVNVYETVSFIGNICSLAKESIITINEDIWHSPKGQKIWRDIQTPDDLPDNIYFVVPIANMSEIHLGKTGSLLVDTPQGIAAIQAALNNVTNVVLVDQQDVDNEPKADMQGFFVSIINDKQNEDGAYHITIKPLYKVHLKEIFRSLYCRAAKIEISQPGEE